MHLPLTPPKSERASCPRCAPAAIVLGFYFLLVLLKSQQPAHRSICVLSVPAIETPAPVVTVTMPQRVFSQRCGYERQETRQMPLMELYDELTDIEKKAVSGYCIPLNEEQKEQMFLHEQKAFAKKYGLTLKVVQQIKAQGRTWYKAEER
jgi:hypothetical protein